MPSDACDLCAPQPPTAASTGHGTDVAHNPRILKLLMVRCKQIYAFCALENCDGEINHRLEDSLLVALQGHRVVTHCLRGVACPLYRCEHFCFVLRMVVALNRAL